MSFHLFDSEKGRHGIGFMAEVLLGSTAEVLLGSTAEVLVVFSLSDGGVLR